MSRESEMRAGPQGSSQELAWMRASVSPSREAAVPTQALRVRTCPAAASPARPASAPASRPRRAGSRIPMGARGAHTDRTGPRAACQACPSCARGGRLARAPTLRTPSPPKLPTPRGSVPQSHPQCPTPQVCSCTHFLAWAKEVGRTEGPHPKSCLGSIQAPGVAPPDPVAKYLQPTTSSQRPGRETLAHDTAGHCDSRMNATLGSRCSGIQIP